MSKTAQERRLADNEAGSIGAMIRTSPRKLNLVAGMIRGMKADAALAALTFSRRRIAVEVKKVLQSAIANAENNHQLDVDRLVVAEAHVGKALVLKRFHARGRGRGARVLKPYSRLTVVVREQTQEAKEGKKAKKAAAKKDKE